MNMFLSNCISSIWKRFQIRAMKCSLNGQLMTWRSLRALVTVTRELGAKLSWSEMNAGDNDI